MNFLNILSYFSKLSSKIFLRINYSFKFFQNISLSIIETMQSIPWKQASRHQTNLSPTKATYAFPKDPRFKATKNNM